MLRFIVFAALVIYFVSSSEGNRKIADQVNPLPGEINYIVSLRYLNSHMCGASILTRIRVLTAAHCVHGLPAVLFSVQYGKTKISLLGNVIPVLSTVYHENYNPNHVHVNDIAVVKLLFPLTFGPFVQPVVLPPPMQIPPAGEYGVLAGWGHPFTGNEIMEDLQRVYLQTYSDTACKVAHASVNALYHMCAGAPEGAKLQCSGDSGGPYVVNGQLQGIMSWPITSCATPDSPGVYCRVSSYIAWINQHLI